MSHDERLTRVERDLAGVQTEQARQGVELASLRGQVSEVGSDVKQLLAREAKRPPQLTLQVVAVTCAGIASIAGVVWWLIGTAPAVVDLARRMDRLDDPVVGRVPGLEKRVDTLTGWGPVQVTKGR